MANTGKEKGSSEDAAARKKTAKPAVAAAKPARSQSPAERIRALEAEINRIRQEEFDSRYNLITQSIEELNAMGYKFRLVDESKGAPRAAKKTAASNENSAPPAGSGLSAHYDDKKYCKLCKEHGHDQKLHAKAGEFQNKAFTNEEKARRGVLPPELQESFVAEHQGVQG